MQIVFSEAWWVGTKEDNPEELKLEFPKEFQNVCALFKPAHLFSSTFSSLCHVPIIYASPFSTDRMARQQTVISEVVQVVPSMKQLEAKLERKLQNLVPQSLHLMTMLLRIQIIRMRITHRL
jgi:hypothetical protein